MIKFIKDFPALLADESILVVGDMHIGLDYKLYKQGINIPNQLPDIEKKLVRLLKKTKAKTLVMLGDVKHEVPGITYPEMTELPKFFDRLSERVNVHICKGNHDTHLEKILSNKITIHPSGGFRIKGYFFYHGHEWPSEDFLECDHLILSHIHPMFEFKDKFGYKVSKPVWIKAVADKEKFSGRYGAAKKGKITIVLVPSFNELLGGYPVNRAKEQIDYMSPVLRNDIVDLKEADLFLLDGTYLGKMKEM